MGFYNYSLLVLAAVLIATFVPQLDASHTLGENVAKKFKDAKSRFDIKAEVGGDGNVIIAMGEKAIQKIHEHRLAHPRTGKIGKAIEIFSDGWEGTLKLLADALDEACDLTNEILSKNIENKEEALSALIFGMNKVKDWTFDSGILVHSCMGAGMSVADIKHKGGFKYAVDKVQETGSGLFEDLDVAQFFAIQGVNADDPEITQKCLEASHSAVKAAAETGFNNFVNGATTLITFLSTVDEKEVKVSQSTEKLHSEAAKQAAANDPATVKAKEVLNKEFEMANKLGINTTFLNILKEGIDDYIDHSAWSVVNYYDALKQALLIAESDPTTAIRLIENASRLSSSILIDGSVLAYEFMGIAGQLTGTLDHFKQPIAIAERCRVEGTEGYKNAEIVAVRGIITGGSAVEHAFDAAHKMLEANEAVIFGRIHKICDLAFSIFNAGGVHGDHLD